MSKPTGRPRGRPRKELSIDQRFAIPDPESGALIALPPGVDPADATPLTEAEAPENTDDGDAEESAIDRIRAQLRTHRDAHASVKLYRLRDDGRTGFCTSYTPDEFESGNLDMIRRQWGEGRYEVRVYGVNEQTNRTALLVRDSFIIEKLSETALARTDPTLIDLLQKMNNRLEALEKAPAPAPVDPMQSFIASMKIMKDMRELFTPANPPSTASTVKEIMETLGAVKAIREEIDPPEAPSDPLAAALPKVLEMITAAQTHQHQQAATPMPLPAVTLPPQLQEPPAPGDNPPQLEDESEELTMIKLAFAYLISQAKKNGDVTEAAELVYEKAPDDLLTLLKAGNWFDQISAAHPQMAPFREWFTKVRDEVLRIENEDTDEAA